MVLNIAVLHNKLNLSSIIIVVIAKNRDSQRAKISAEMLAISQF